jgi:hypothetical protein
MRLWASYMDDRWDALHPPPGELLRLSAGTNGLLFFC